MSNFPSFSGTSVQSEDIITFLELLHEKGYDVRKGDRNDYYIVFEDSGIIHYINRGKRWYVESSLDGKLRVHNEIVNHEQLIAQSNEAARCIGKKLGTEQQLKSVRLSAEKPASNKSKLVKLLNGKKITTIFDPYFDTKSLNTLLTLFHLGIEFTDEVRCLKTTKSKLDLNYLKNFEQELSLKFDVKCCKSNSEHRRFLILSDQSIVIIGMSLNDIDKNEAIRIEVSVEDIEFFENQWNAAKNCI